MDAPRDTTALIKNMVESYDSGRLSRRNFIAGLAALIGAGSQAVRAAEASPFTAVNTNHIAIRVTDIARSRDFYKNLLGMGVATENSSSCFLDMETGFLTLFRGDAPGLDHFCFGVENYDVEKAEQLLKDAGLESRRPRGTDRIYFSDPDGLTVQISSAGHSA